MICKSHHHLTSLHTHKGRGHLRWCKSDFRVLLANFFNMYEFGLVVNFCLKRLWFLLYQASYIGCFFWLLENNSLRWSCWWWYGKHYCSSASLSWCCWSSQGLFGSRLAFSQLQTHWFSSFKKIKNLKCHCECYLPLGGFFILSTGYCHVCQFPWRVSYSW